MADIPDGTEAPGTQVTDDPCTRCGEKTVVQVYERFASRVLCCLSCEHVWTNEPNGDPGDPAGAA